MALRIYFCGSVTGGREYAHIHTIIIEHLKKYGKVWTEHLSGKNKELNEKGEASKSLAPEQIYERDITWLENSDLVVAEVTVPSLGVGYELAYAEKLSLPILCLFDKKSSRTLSAMIRGNKNFKVFYYESEEDIKKAIDKFVEEVAK